ncbi:MAG: HAMP domain-containing histidine kinase [Flavobacterium sp.]|nr:MAG: HAMP domain-containing histidine kinase [Flavobacterium sp.]
MSQLINSTNGLPNASNVNFVFDLKSLTFLYLDQSILALLKKKDSSSIGELKDLVHEDDLDIVEYALERLLDGISVGIVKFRIASESEEIWFGVLPFLELNEPEPAIYGNIMDITSELENFSSISKYANKKNSVLHMLSHDLRGPLGMANSLIAVLEKDMDQPKNLEKTKAISSIIRESINLIEDLVNREFLDTIGAALVKKRIDIVKKLSEYVEECKRSAQLADRNFSLISSSKIIQVEVDEAKFMQIVNNLISNALKFTYPNGNISIGIDDHHDRVEVSFSDDGIGIPEDLLPGIFDRFTKSKRVGLNGQPTTGLGLSIVKEVIDWHNAKIVCESKEDVGTTFRITLQKDPKQDIGNY